MTQRCGGGKDIWVELRELTGRPRELTLGLCLTGLGSWPSTGERLASGRGGREGLVLPGKEELSRAHWLGGPGLTACLGDWYLERGRPSPPHTHTQPHGLTDAPLSGAYISTHSLNCSASALPSPPSSPALFFHLISLTSPDYSFMITSNVYCLSP